MIYNLHNGQIVIEFSGVSSTFYPGAPERHVIMREYIHTNPGEETRSVPLFFTVREEGRLELDGREVLYLVGETPIGSACVGAGVLSYIFVHGCVLEWHAAVRR